MPDNKEVLGLDLDVSDFKDGLNVAKEGLSSLTEGTNLNEFGNLISKIGLGIGLVGAAALALKVTFDEVFQGDQIKRTNNLFNDLASTFNITGDAFKEDMIKAAGGLADSNSIIEATNKSMVILGENSSMLPQIMELARKATVAFGGDVIERFQGLSMAIATGNERMLRQSGIVIDSKKAMLDFAQSIGATVNELSEAGRQQAIFNAVMDYSHTNMKAMTGNVNDTTMAWQIFKTEVKEAADAIALAFNKVFGPKIQAMITGLGQAFHSVAQVLKSEFGLGAEQAGAKLEVLKDKLHILNQEIEEAKQRAAKGDSWLSRMLFGNAADEVAKLQAEANKTQAEMDALQKQQDQKAKQSEEQRTESHKQANRARFVDDQKVAQDRVKLEDEVQKIQDHNAEMAVKQANSEEAFERARHQREIEAYKRYNLELEKIDTQLATGQIANKKLADQKKVQLAHQLNQKLSQYDKDYRKEHKQMLQNMVDDSRDAFQGIANAAHAAASQAEEDLHNWGQQGKTVMDTFKKEGSSMFQSFGQAAVDHSKSASEIMKGFFLNSLADIAQAEGELFLTAGLADPTKLAAGAALLALSGALRAMAGSVGSSSSSLGSYGGGGGSSYNAASNDTTPSANTSPTGNLTINIQGDYLNTAETQRTLLQSIRDATDQTGFQYLQIGQTGAQSY